MRDGGANIDDANDNVNLTLNAGTDGSIDINSKLGFADPLGLLTITAKSVTLDADGWTIRTADGSPSAHFEHTIAITDDTPEILTR